MPPVIANGLTLEVESFGMPEDPAIILIMGLGMQLIAWPEALCQGLADRGFHVIRFDNRDAGLSSRISGKRTGRLPLAMTLAALGLPIRTPYRLDDMANDTVALMDALGIARAHIVGASMGGMIGQRFAARFPDRTLSLTSIMSTSGHRRLSRPTPAAARALLSRPKNPQDPESVVDHLVYALGAVASPGYPMDPKVLRDRVRRTVQRSHDRAGVARQLLAVVADGSRRKLLRTIRTPTLVIHGREDPLVPLAAGHDTAAQIPGAHLEVIEGMGHDLPDALIPKFIELISNHCKKGSPNARAK